MGFGLWRRKTCACPCPDAKSRSELPDRPHPLLLVPGCAALRAAPVRSPRMQVLQVLHPRAGLGVCFVYLRSCPSENVRQSQGAQPFQLGLLFSSYLLCFCFYVSPVVGKPFSEDAIFHWQRELLLPQLLQSPPQDLAVTKKNTARHSFSSPFGAAHGSPQPQPGSLGAPHGQERPRALQAGGHGDRGRRAISLPA